MKILRKGPPSAGSIWTHLHVNIFFLRQRTRCLSETISFERDWGHTFFNVKQQTWPFKITASCHWNTTFRVVVFSADQVFCSTAPYASCTCQEQDLHTSSIKFLLCSLDNFDTPMINTWIIPAQTATCSSVKWMNDDLIMPFRWIIHSLLQVNKFRKCVMNGDISNRPPRGCNQATASSETWPLISLCPSVAIPSLRSKNGWFNSKTVPWLPPELGNGGEHCKSQIWLFRHLRPNWKSFWITTNVLQNRFHLVSCLTMRVNSSSLSIALCCDKVETPTSPLEKHPFLEHSIAVLWKLQPKTLNNNSGAPVLFHVFESLSVPCGSLSFRDFISSVLLRLNNGISKSPW